MKNTLKLIVATGIIATSTAPLFAETVIGDPMSTSCGTYLKQSDADRLSLAMQYDAYQAMSETEKAAVEAMTEAQRGTMIMDARTKRAALSAEELAKMTTTANEWMTKINAKCQANGEKIVVDAMDTGM